MKKLIFFCLSFLVALEGVSQSCGDDGFWKIGSQFGTQRLSSNCGDFICHGFAAAYWEEGFIQGTSLNSTNPGIVNVKTQYTQSGGGPTETYFRDSPLYVQVCGQSLSNVDVVTQKFNIADGFHSLVRDRNTTFNPKFISKYGESPVIRHDFDSTFYELQNAGKTEPDKYYVYIGSIKVTEYLPKGQIKPISLLSKPGATYSWSIIGTPGIVSFTSGTNAASVSLRGDSFGTTQVKVTISGCSGIPPKEQIITIIVPAVTISGTYTTSNSTNHTLGNGNQVPSGNVSTYLSMTGINNFVWERYQGNLPFWAHTNQMHFTMQSGNYVSFRIYARSSSNDTLAVRNVTYYNYGNFSLYPNPSSSSISIKSDYNGHMDLEIIPLYKSSKILEFKITADEKVDIQDLPKGDYLVRVRIGEDVVLESRLIKNE
ncbi:Por secretion system C-terminal sorting domain-containing protein [Algoriphagus faecimaris]|uniref:Por secretion system C-terminal sorting domain-containing protein n=2 Tax=Algoriphagus TaxID=246875 RepID=A0A1G6Q3X6_9BACT|nr:T9SS type A sorting domain-containing protein [Algoriphagus faecimaris]SDC86644.1 Por secretion system C-terminal sorting domain-containing protein [Algoriphagus faecimaris]